MSKTCVIRPAGPEDRETLVSMMGRFHAEQSHKQGIEVTDDDPVVTLSVDMLMASLEDKTGGCWLAIADQKIVGYAFLTSGPMGGGLYTDPAYRNLGIGAALMAERERFEAGLGKGRGQLSVMANNHDAIALYTKLGWQFEQATSGEASAGDGKVLRMIKSNDHGPQFRK